MAMIGKIRWMRFRQHKSLREIARSTSLSRNTIRKWLKTPMEGEPKYRRKLRDIKAYAVPWDADPAEKTVTLALPSRNP